MYTFVVLILFGSSLLRSVAIRYESPYHLNKIDNSVKVYYPNGTHPLPVDGSCSDDQMCPPCFFCEEGHCKCGPTLPNAIIVCDDKMMTTSVLDCYCATYNEDRNVTQIGACIYNCGNINLYIIYCQ